MFIRSAMVCLALLTGCAGSQVTEMASATPRHSVKTIAMMPGSGLLAEAVAVEMMNRGYTVLDPQQTSSLLVRLNLTEIEVTKPEGLGRLKAEGLDALLTVRGAAGADGLPTGAVARLTSTTSGSLLAGVTWQNGWGGVSGSPADRTMRKGLMEAAREIAEAIQRRAQ